MSTLFDTTAPAERDPRTAWPSVTRILKLAGLSTWQDVTLDQVRRATEHRIPERTLAYLVQGVYPEVLERKRELGSNVHLACQDLERGIEPWWDGMDIAPYVEAYRRFRSENEFRPTAWEQQVYNDTYKYKGRYDTLGMVGTYEVLIDLKTTVQMAGELPYQLAAYDLCLNSNPKRLRWGVQLRKDGAYQLHEYKDRNDSRIFLAAVAIANAKGFR
jgi:hypothetical protein